VVRTSRRTITTGGDHRARWLACTYGRAAGYVPTWTWRRRRRNSPSHASGPGPGPADAALACRGQTYRDGEKTHVWSLAAGRATRCVANLPDPEGPGQGREPVSVDDVSPSLWRRDVTDVLAAFRCCVGVWDPASAWRGSPAGPTGHCILPLATTVGNRPAGSLLHSSFTNCFAGRLQQSLANLQTIHTKHLFWFLSRPPFLFPFSTGQGTLLVLYCLQFPAKQLVTRCGGSVLLIGDPANRG